MHEINGEHVHASRQGHLQPWQDPSVSYRIKSLERHLGTMLFSRLAHGVRLNPQGQAYLQVVQRIFADLIHETGRHRARRRTPLLKLVSIEVVAEKWLMPQPAEFKAAHPEITIEFDVDHDEVDLDRRDFDVWIAFADQVPDTIHSERLLEETLFPVCSPRLIAARGRPGGRAICMAGLWRTTLGPCPPSRGRCSRRGRRTACPRRNGRVLSGRDGGSPRTRPDGNRRCSAGDAGCSKGSGGAHRNMWLTRRPAATSRAHCAENDTRRRRAPPASTPGRR